jgi:hypothetical protein
VNCVFGGDERLKLDKKLITVYSRYKHPLYNVATNYVNIKNSFGEVKDFCDIPQFSFGGVKEFSVNVILDHPI